MKKKLVMQDFITREERLKPKSTWLKDALGGLCFTGLLITTLVLFWIF